MDIYIYICICSTHLRLFIISIHFERIVKCATSLTRYDIIRLNTADSNNAAVYHAAWLYAASIMGNFWWKGIFIKNGSSREHRWRKLDCAGRYISVRRQYNQVGKCVCVLLQLAPRLFRRSLSRYIIIYGAELRTLRRTDILRRSLYSMGVRNYFNVKGDINVPSINHIARARVYSSRLIYSAQTYIRANA